MIIMIVGGLAGAWSLTIGCSHRDDVVLLSAEEYQRLRSLDRQAMHVSELSDDELAALAAVEIPAEDTRYNHEPTADGASTSSTGSGHSLRLSLVERSADGPERWD